MSFKVGAYTIPEPNPFVISPSNIEKKERLANGTLVIDYIDVKKIFNLTFPTIYWSELKNILTVLEAGDFFTFQYDDEGTESLTATVYCSNYPRRLRFEDPTADNWLYTDIGLTFEEQ